MVNAHLDLDTMAAIHRLALALLPVNRVMGDEGHYPDQETVISQLPEVIEGSIAALPLEYQARAIAACKHRLKRWQS